MRDYLGASPLTSHAPGCTLVGMEKNINLPLTAELLEAIDKARGDVPRTVWIRRAIEQRLEKEQ